MNQKNINIKPWTWVPSLYFAEGLPYVAVMSLSVIMYKNLGLNNTQIAFYTSWLYLPWTLKFLWSPFVDILKSKRWWIVMMQFLIGAALAGVALSIPGPKWLQWSMMFFWLMAFSSATHDIAADGFYMHGLETKQQQFFIGVRNTFYRIAMICGQGLLVMLAGKWEKGSDNPLGMEAVPFAWMMVFLLMALVFIILAIYHAFCLPRPTSDVSHRKNVGGNVARATAEKEKTAKDILTELGGTFSSFIRKPHIVSAIAFMLLYRFAEAQLVKLSSPFLLDSVEVGGLGMSTASVGFAYGTLGVVALLTGGILGGIVISRRGLSKSIIPMAWALCLPNLVYLFMAITQLQNQAAIYACISLEQLGYGYGFTAYTAYLLHFCRGQHKTAHYAFCTAFMALGMMIPGMFAGKLQSIFDIWFANNIGGYTAFFIWIMIGCIPCIWISFVIRRKVRQEEKTQSPA